MYAIGGPFLSCRSCLSRVSRGGPASRAGSGAVVAGAGPSRSHRTHDAARTGCTTAHVAGLVAGPDGVRDGARSGV
ncbi:hypothetical protein CXF36_10715, partial [Corynebacterium bovis]